MEIVVRIVVRTVRVAVVVVVVAVAAIERLMVVS